MTQEIRRPLAPESAKIRKTREKLLKHHEDADSKITPEALKQMAEEIHRWIARHAQVRVPLKDKNIALFDENQNAARISQRVSAIAQKIQEEMQYPNQRSFSTDLV